MSDLHLGSVGVDLKRIKEDLDLARERNARVIMIGDVFDMILPKDSRRYQPSQIVSGLRDRDDQVDAAVEYAVAILGPYADLIDMISLGNHEHAVIKYHSTDPVKQLIRAMSGHGQTIAHGGYTGYLQYVRIPHATSKHRRNYQILYHHGGGGSAPVSKGMIDVNRKRVNWVYDAFVFGHKHNAWASRDVTIYLTSNGSVQANQTRDIQTGTYLRYYTARGDDPTAVNYGEMGGGAPRPIGGVFVKFRFDAQRKGRILEQRVEV